VGSRRGALRAELQESCFATLKESPMANHESAYERSFPDRLIAKTSFVALEVSHDGNVWHSAAALREPESTMPRAAVVFVHGSGGVDSRGQCYANALNEAGMVTLEIDLWAARGVNSPLERPKAVSETLPDAFAALDFLTHRHGIDPARIGIMGTSWGGIVSMLTATEMARAEFAKGAQRFAAHAPLYPACWVYNRVPGFDFHTLTGVPVFIQTGANDLYDDPDSCAKLVESLAPADKVHVTFATYPGATHAWDRREPDIVANDPYAHKGKGGEVPFRYNPEATRKSTEAVVAFFSRTLAPKS
jgi:dienelactone hydrolase